MKYSILILSAFLFFTSCASVYKTIKPESLDYSGNTNSSDKQIEISYKGNVLNGNYAKREKASGISLVAIKISNYSDWSITPQKNISIFANEDEVEKMDIQSFSETVQQNPARSSKFLFLLPANIYYNANYFRK